MFKKDKMLVHIYIKNCVVNTYNYKYKYHRCFILEDEGSKTLFRSYIKHLARDNYEIRISSGDLYFLRFNRWC